MAITDPRPRAQTVRPPTSCGAGEEAAGTHLAMTRWPEPTTRRDRPPAAVRRHVPLLPVERPPVAASCSSLRLDGACAGVCEVPPDKAFSP